MNPSSFSNFASLKGRLVVSRGRLERTLGAPVYDAFIRSRFVADELLRVRLEPIVPTSAPLPHTVLHDGAVVYAEGDLCHVDPSLDYDVRLKTSTTVAQLASFRGEVDDVVLTLKGKIHKLTRETAETWHLLLRSDRTEYDDPWIVACDMTGFDPVVEKHLRKADHNRTDFVKVVCRFIRTELDTDCITRRVFVKPRIVSLLGIDYHPYAEELPLAARIGEAAPRLVQRPNLVRRRIRNRPGPRAAVLGGAAARCLREVKALGSHPLLPDGVRTRSDARRRFAVVPGPNHRGSVNKKVTK